MALDDGRVVSNFVAQVIRRLFKAYLEACSTAPSVSSDAQSAHCGRPFCPDEGRLVIIRVVQVRQSVSRTGSVRPAIARW